MPRGRKPKNQPQSKSANLEDALKPFDSSEPAPEATAAWSGEKPWGEPPETQSETGHDPNKWPAGLPDTPERSSLIAILSIDYDEWKPETYRGVQARVENNVEGTAAVFSTGDVHNDLEAAEQWARGLVGEDGVILNSSSVDHYFSDVAKAKELDPETHPSIAKYGEDAKYRITHKWLYRSVDGCPRCGNQSRQRGSGHDDCWHCECGWRRCAWAQGEGKPFSWVGNGRDAYDAELGQAAGLLTVVECLAL